MSIPSHRFNKDTDPSPSQIYASPNVGDVKIIYHPNSRRAERVLSAAIFQAEQDEIAQPPQPSSTRPWLPFSTRLDFEVAELMLHAGMNAGLVDRTIQLFKRAKDRIDPEDDFSLKNNTHVQSLWEKAGERATRVR
jgi:hypothetical protein